MRKQIILAVLAARAGRRGLVLLAACLALAATWRAQEPSGSRQHAEKGMQLAQAGDLAGAESELRLAVKLSPESPEYLTELGGVLGMQTKLEESTVYFERALKVDPENLAVRRNLASNQWRMGRFEEARKNLERVLKVKPHDPPATLLLGMVAENLKDYAAAARLLGSVPELVRERPESIAALARSCYRTTQKEKARQTLEGLLEKTSSPEGVFLGGKIAADAQDYEMAEKLFQSIRASYPDAAALGYGLALVQYQAHRFADSRNTLQELLNAGFATSDIYNLLAWCNYQQNHADAAVKAFEEAIRRDPQREQNYTDLGKVLLERRMFPAAQALARRAVETLPASGTAYKLKGTVELRLQFYKDAVASYGQAVELDPSSAEANLGLAVAQWSSGNTGQAAATFEGGLKRFPRDPDHYAEYARLLTKLAEAGDPSAESRAVSLLEKAVALDPKRAEPHYELGEVFLTEGKPQKARQELETAAKLEPKSSRIHYALARADRRLGRGAEAARELALYEQLKSEESSVASSASPALGRNESRP